MNTQKRKPGRPLVNPELGPMTRITLAVHQEVLDKAEEIAAANNTTLTAWLRAAVQEKLDNSKRK